MAYAYTISTKAVIKYWCNAALGFARNGWISGTEVEKTFLGWCRGSLSAPLSPTFHHSVSP
jgi:hypothetical protein